MLTMQSNMNTRVHQDWAAQNFEWYRAIWIECGELVEHYGYKWWKKQQPDLPQVQLEVIDIWHFGLSALFQDGKSIEALAAEIERAVIDYKPIGMGVREATEALALDSLNTHGFSPTKFWELMTASGLDFESLYSAYVGKNVLNFFRQDNGYKDGSYIKNWAGREDNEHLVELVAALDHSAEDFAGEVYKALEIRYQELAQRE
ncbi:MAG: dimeric dUTPase (all-alpha-NTP-PPase superfamily) [Halioglobus sp.]|jgi:dimeric dUTPase (all-alpha-NTP-PPase superfamily)